MKKTIQLTLALLISTLSLFSQTKQTATADRFFDNISYVDAANKYKELAEKNPTEHVLKRLGDSYYYNVKMKEASEAYAKLFKNFTPEESEYMFKYAQALRAVGNFKESKVWMQKFHQTKLKDSRGEEFTDKNANIEAIKNEKPLYEVSNLVYINTENSDFGVTDYNNIIFFSSTRKVGKFVKNTHTRNNKPFLDIFYVSKDKLNSANEKTPLSDEINTKYHESSVSFSPDKKIMYFTRNNYNEGRYRKDEKGYNNLKIYRAEYVNKKWINIIELPFNSDAYSVGHPSVSKDGKRLYFTSNMPGSIGQTDIFYVAINGDNTYGEVKNLGPKVNTEGREMFPFISDDDVLYFSSDGHFGIGALDVFSSKLENGRFQKPANLKAPVNSQLDDFAFSINPNTKKGYLSSNRKGGAGDDDIYAVIELQKTIPIIEKPCLRVITGTVRDQMNQKIPNARIVLKDAKGIIVKDTITNEFGDFKYKLTCNKNYIITGLKEYYKNDTASFTTNIASKIKLNLSMSEEFTLNDVNELIIKINPIYFNFNKTDIRPDAARELNKVVAVMEKYPNMIIAGNSHTDARGNANYNQKLSERRAKSTVDYIISRGINPDRISDKGYGETQLVNGCVDNDTHSNREKCTSEEHQANRRTEFVIISFRKK
ncbi:OmpA family protein [Polaribacter haliotis]|uniref:OmpA family protein n=1 Tax=Polaribacter haliotis TaxID=1888915 RepID=A0A7L8AIF7_9FLAO|nr:OmpA family protein [Polaribacter haliotis]QOD61724.1 OmpA family protein [Polaribacter haliotis]